MKKIALFAGIALLAACGEREDAAAPEAAATEAAPAPDAGDVAAGPTTANGAGPGTYDVTLPDGTKSIDTLMADGTYVSRDTSDKVIDKGKWAVKDGKTCFMPEGKAEECFTEGAPAADGSFDATGADGKVTKVAPRAK